MFAIIRTGGKQYRVAEEDLVTVDKISGQPGDAVQFAEVLLVGGESILIGSPHVSGATVAGEVVEQGRGEKVIAFKKRRRKNSRRKRGHRQEFSVIRITEILTEGRKPRPKAEAAPRVEAAPQPAPEAKAEPKAEKAQAKPAKPKAAKPAKKPAKPKAEKPAGPAKKPAAKKPTADTRKGKKK